MLNAFSGILNPNRTDFLIPFRNMFNPIVSDIRDLKLGLPRRIINNVKTLVKTTPFNFEVSEMIPDLDALAAEIKGIYAAFSMNIEIFSDNIVDMISKLIIAGFATAGMSDIKDILFRRIGVALETYFRDEKRNDIKAEFANNVLDELVRPMQILAGLKSEDDLAFEIVNAVFSKVTPSSFGEGTIGIRIENVFDSLKNNDVISNLLKVSTNHAEFTEFSEITDDNKDQIADLFGENIEIELAGELIDDVFKTKGEILKDRLALTAIFSQTIDDEDDSFSDEEIQQAKDLIENNDPGLLELLEEKVGKNLPVFDDDPKSPDVF